MVGQYEIIIYNNKIQYRLNIKRNITLLRGNSGTGKSELIRLIGQYNSNRVSSGITIKSEKQCNVLTEENWKLFIESYTERIFFIDEGNSFLRTKAFAETIKNSDNYYVIVSRENLPHLPYSIEEIYGLREGKDSGKYVVPKRVYNEMYRIYSDVTNKDMIPDVIVTEDSNSGNEFFEKLYPGRCISSYGSIERIGKSLPFNIPIEN